MTEQNGRLDRVKRISARVSLEESGTAWGWITNEHMYAAMLRAVVQDFPQFRTAAKPNDWEKGYHTVLETLWDIANELDDLADEKLGQMRKDLPVRENETL